MIYRGLMKTSLLNDRSIRPTEYRRWSDAVRRFGSRDKDRRAVEEKKRLILAGKVPPLVLGIDDRYHDVYVADGHHRAVALMELRAEKFPFHWYWIRSFGVRMEHTPFPHHLLD